MTKDKNGKQYLDNFIPALQRKCTQRTGDDQRSEPVSIQHLIRKPDKNPYWKISRQAQGNLITELLTKMLAPKAIGKKGIILWQDMSVGV